MRIEIVLNVLENTVRNSLVYACMGVVKNLSGNSEILALSSDVLRSKMDLICIGLIFLFV